MFISMINQCGYHLQRWCFNLDMMPPVLDTNLPRRCVHGGEAERGYGPPGQHGGGQETHPFISAGPRNTAESVPAGQGHGRMTTVSSARAASSFTAETDVTYQTNQRDH